MTRGRRDGEGQIKPIETRYAGYRFRSRAEARWAVFFDHLGIQWEYEPEGYELPGGIRYLPDFWLPNENAFFEVKGGGIDEGGEEMMKAALLAHTTLKRVLLVGGPVGKNEIIEFWGLHATTQEMESWIEQAVLSMPQGLFVAYEEWVAKPRRVWVPKNFAKIERSPVAIDFNEEFGLLALIHAWRDDDKEPRRDPWGRPYEYEPDSGRFWSYHQPLCNYTEHPAGQVDWSGLTYRALTGPQDVVLSTKAIQAIRAAQSARFEFGESGAG